MTRGSGRAIVAAFHPPPGIRETAQPNRPLTNGQRSIAATTIDLQLLGGLDFLGPAPALSVRARRRHPMMLLALVAAAAPRAISRDRIMAFLWPESDSTRASNSLRQALHSLRRDLDVDLFLPETAGGIQLDHEKVNVDLWVFRDAVAKRAPAEAVAAHRGPFLDGFQIGGPPEFCHWVEAEREQVERAYRAALDTLARQAESAARHDEAVAWRRRLAAADPFSSRVALGLLKALTAAGDRPGAIEHAAVHDRLVRSHLEVEPDPAIAEFVALLRTPPRGRPALEPAPAPSAPAAEASATEASAALTTAVVPRAAPDPGVWGSRVPLIRARWLGAAGVVALIAFGAVGAMAVYRPAGNFIMLASGGSPVAGRDTDNRLVACEGPICPGGTLPQDAYIVPAHVAYTRAPTGTHFIAPAAEGATLKPPGYACCSTAVFENEFTLPSDAVSATITITLLADNQGIVSINGREFGRQADRNAPWNHGGPPATFATTFPPDPSGVNRLRVTLWDGGGAVGLNYRALVTHDTGGETGGGQ